MEDKDDTKTIEKLLPRAPRSLLSWSALNPFDHKDDLNKHLLVVDDVADRVEESDLESSRDLEDEMDDTPTSPSTGGKSNQFAVTLNFLNTIVGAGIVGLPYVFRIAGFYMGIILLCLGSFLTDYTVRLLVRTGMRHEQCNYEDLCQYALGNLGQFLVTASMFVFDFGAILSYLIIMGDAGTLVVQHIFSQFKPVDGGENDTVRRITIVVLAMTLILPLCLFRDVSKLEKAATFSVITVIFVIGVVLYEMITIGLPSDAGTLSFVEGQGFVSAFGIVSFAFVCHDSAFLLNNTLKDNHKPSRWACITHGALGSALLICLSLAVPGFLTFRDGTCGNLLNNYDPDAVAIIVMRAVYVLTMASTYPISFFVVRHITNVAIWGGTKNFKSIQEMPLSRHLLLTLTLFFISVGIVMFVKNLGVVMAVAGSVGGGCLAYILPPLCNIVLSKYSILFWRNTGHVLMSIRALGPPLAVLIFGFVVIPLVVYETIVNASDGCN
eukprot:g4795.t1